MTDELEELEHEGWRALSGPDGVAFYRDVMADDGVMVFPGMVMDKARALEASGRSPGKPVPGSRWRPGGGRSDPSLVRRRGCHGAGEQLS